jgi:LAO/AO transport system kinase
MSDDLIVRFRKRDRSALSRLVTLVARGDSFPELDAMLAGEPPCKPRVVAITGSGGVGKSSLVGRLLETIRGDGKTVAVLACDPQSPLSGGALLGDRFRMGSSLDDGIFIRSLAAPGGRGAVADHLPRLLRLLAHFGFDVVLIETVGAGQGDVGVQRAADTVVLLVQPEAGDELQWEKAGILEIADVVVVNKGDLPGSERTAAQVRGMLDLTHASTVSVLRASAKTGEGIAELWRHLQSLVPSSRGLDASQLFERVAEEAGRRAMHLWSERDAEVREIADGWQEGRLSEVHAVDEILKRIAIRP